MEPARAVPLLPAVLRPRPLVRHLAIGVLVVGVPLAAATWTALDQTGVLASAALVLLVVVLPVWAIWFTTGRSIVVHADRVVVRRGDREVRTFWFDDLTGVRPGLDGSAGGATPETWNRSIVLLGRTTAGKRRGLKISAQTVESIDPVVLALAPVVERRPELLSHEIDRTLFDEHVRALGSGHQRG